MDWIVQQLYSDPQLTFELLLGRWVEGFGIWFWVILFAIIFCETGLVVTPFLPGDSLLFLVGALIANVKRPLGDPATVLPLMLAVLTVAAVLGDAVNYSVGYALGPRVFRWESSRLLNKQHLLRAQEFYDRHGGKAIFLARFVPIVRTFAPFVAGIGKMNYGRFSMFNVTGGITWVVLCVVAGFYFGEIPWVKKNFEAVMVAIVLLSVLPLAIEWYKERRRSAREKEALVAAQPPK